MREFRGALRVSMIRADEQGFSPLCGAAVVAHRRTERAVKLFAQVGENDGKRSKMKTTILLLVLAGFNH